MGDVDKLSVHITCGQSKKVLSCALSELRDSIEQCFQLEGTDYILQTWESDFEDWVDIEDVSLLRGSNKCKLQVVVRNIPVTTQDIETASSNVTVGDGDATDDREMNASSCDDSSTTPVASGARAFPAVYKLPKFPEYMLQSLENREPICRDEKFRAKIVRVLFDDLLQYGLYPGERAYADACRSLVSKYPFLKDRHCSNGPDFQSWLKRLRDKFKKYRSRSKDLTSASDVQKMKLKYGRKRTEASPNLNPDDQQPVVKVQRVREIDDPPEDERSVQAHLSALQRECAKSKPNYTVIAEKMVRTLSHRTKMVQDQPLAAVLKEYPCLCQERGILSEGESTFRIHSETLRSFLLQNIDKIDKLAKGRGQVLRDSYVARERTDDRDVTYAAMMLAHGLGEKTLVSDARRRTPYPQVVFSGDMFEEKTAYTVIADSVEVVTCSNIVAAITACFLVHWIFDIQYPKLFKNTLTFLDVHVFQKRSVRATQKVLTYINRF